MASDTGKIRARGKKGILSIRYYDRNGRQREESTHTTDWTEAARLLKNAEAAIAAGAAITPQIGRFRFEDGVALIKADYAIKENDSWPAVDRRIRLGLTPTFAGQRLARVTSAALRKFAAARKEAGASHATINRELAALRRMFTLAIGDGLLLTRPTFPTLSEKGRQRKGFFEIPQWQSVYRHLSADHQPWATIAYYTGWRVKREILSREWAHVDRDQQTIRIDAEDTKDGKARIFAYGPFPDAVADIEKCWTVHREAAKAGRLEPRVFVRMTANTPGVAAAAARWKLKATATGKGTPIKSYRKAWITATEAAGAPGRIPHDFRRTAARNLDRAGVPRGTGKRMIGHQTDEMYERYGIVSEGDMLAGADQLAAGLARDAAKIRDRAAKDAAADPDQGQIQGQIPETASEARKGQNAKLRRVK
jgi:integrase